MTKSIQLIYISLSGNTESFVKRLTDYLTLHSTYQVDVLNVKDLVKSGESFFAVSSDFIAFLPTYLEGGNGLDNGDVEILTTPLREFIAYGDNAKHCLGVVGSGNKNFNHQYCLTAKQYAQQFDFPVIDTFELRGLSDDVARIGQKLLALLSS